MAEVGESVGVRFYYENVRSVSQFFPTDNMYVRPRRKWPLTF